MNLYAMIVFILNFIWRTRENND